VIEDNGELKVRLDLRQQPLPLDHPDSTCMFQGLVVPSRAALESFGEGVIECCMIVLRTKAQENAGLYFLQTFVDRVDGRMLTFVDDGREVKVSVPRFPPPDLTS
jgi:hypothetical protein